jgi:ABC-type lipopolysaccharide export system ATPase subunit
MYKRTRLGLGYLPQEPSVFRKLTVEKNLLGVLELRKELSKRERSRDPSRSCLPSLTWKRCGTKRVTSSQGGSAAVPR